MQRDVETERRSDAAAGPTADDGAAKGRERTLTPAARRALEEAAARRAAAEGAADRPAEVGGRKGPEPVRYGDWEVKGLATDF